VALRTGSPAGASRSNRIVGAAIVLLIALLWSCGHKSQSGVWSRESGVQTDIGAPLAAPGQTDVGAPLAAPAEGRASTAPTPDPQFTALQKYAASLPPVTGQTVEPIRFGERQADGTYIRDGRKMTLGEILASAPKVACPPLTQIRLPGDWNKPAAPVADKPASTGKTTSGVGDIINPPQIPQVPQIGPPGSWNFGPIIGNPGPISPPIFGGPPPPGHVPYVGEGAALYNRVPIAYPIWEDGPPVDVGIIHWGPGHKIPGLAVLTKHTIQVILDPLMGGGIAGFDGPLTWSAHVVIALPTDVLTWYPLPQQVVHGAWGQRLRVADVNSDGREDLVVSMNWDDPSYPYGANQFGYTGTWVYYQNGSGLFDEPFSPGGCSRENDIVAYWSDDEWHQDGSRTLDLLCVQNPHVAPLNMPQSWFWDSWMPYADEYYPHVKFKETGPAMGPGPQLVLFYGAVSVWSWSIEKIKASTDNLDDLLVAFKSIWDGGITTSGAAVWLATSYTTYGGSMFILGWPTQGDPFRARPGRFDTREPVDDYVATFPSANSIMIGHCTTPVDSGVHSGNSKWEFYTPRVIFGGLGRGIGNPKEVLVPDIDNDGLSDLVVLSDSTLYVLHNLGNRSFFITNEFQVHDEVQRAAVGHLFNTGEQDIAVIDTPSSSVIVYRPVTK